MDLAVLKTYLHVVEEGSFAAAARRLGISKSMSSKHISDLEASLGVRLLTRSTRSVSTTASGQDYYEKLRHILSDLEDANETLRGISARPSGKLRIGAPACYTMQMLNPLVMGFMEAYPEVQLDLMLDDGRSDLAADGFDAVIRIGDLEDSAMIARRLHHVAVSVVGAPAYLEEFGSPEVPGDLTRHRCLHFNSIRGAGTWPFEIDGRLHFQRITPALTTNSTELLRAAVLEGKGLAPMLEYSVAADLEAGRLVRVLSEFSLSDLPVHLVYPPGRNMTAALRVFIDYLTKARIGQPLRDAA